MVTVEEKPRAVSEWQRPAENHREAPMSPQQIKRSAEVVAGGFSGEALVAAVTVVLTIIGLATAAPLILASVAALAISVALLLKAGSVAARFRELSAETGDTPGTRIELGAGMLTELAAGAAGIVLGVLALVGIVPLVLLASAAILFGAALLLGGGETYRVSVLSNSEEQLQRRRESRTAGKSAASAETLGGMAAIVLGIIALAGAAPLILTLVAFLIIGSVQLIAGIADSSQMATLLSASH